MQVKIEEHVIYINDKTPYGMLTHPTNSESLKNFNHIYLSFAS